MRNLNSIIAVLTLGFSLNVSGQINQNCSGSVGIGTSNPSTIGGFEKVLDINGNSSSKVSSTTNTNSITTSLMSSIYGNWGAVGTQSNHRFLFFVNNLSKMSIETTGEVRVSDRIRLGSYYNTIKLATEGSFGQASGFDFNASTSTPGITFEQGASESSGFYSDGDYAVIWSPGDQNRLLRVYDEDGMNEKWYLDGSGYAHTVSDSSTKENINDFQVLQKLKELNTIIKAKRISNKKMR